MGGKPKDPDYHKKYRETHPRDNARETERARELRAERRKGDPDFVPRGQYQKLDANWDDPEWVRKYMREYKAEWANKPENKKRLADKRHTPEFRKKNRLYKRAIRAEERIKNPPRKRLPNEYATQIQERARSAVTLALKKGELVLGLCAHRDHSVCVGRIEGHHWKGYEEEAWLDVVWLCRKHHMIEEWEQTGEFLPFEEEPEPPVKRQYAWDSWVDNEHKRCSRCSMVKHKDEYYKDPRKSDGRYAKCRSCHNSVAVAGRIAKREK